MKKVLSVFLIFGILMSVFPMTVVNAADTLQDRTNINMDYKYDKTLSQVQREARDGQIKIMSDKDSGSVKWNHVSYLSYNYGDIREKLTSTNPDDKYIVLDKDSKVQLGYSAYETVEISSDKVLDLNGHTIQINDIRNKANGSDKFYQSDNSAHFNTVMFSITNGATLTIIDSSDDGSGNGKGEIYTNAYMVNPYKYSLKRYTTRDIFEVDDGNLVIYGGTFQAGRSKAQADDDTYDKIKAVVGSTVALATDVAGYATSITSLIGQYEDISFNKKRELDKILKEDQNRDNPDSSKEQKEAATPKKDGSDAKAEKKESTPTDNAENGKEGRNQTVAEKQQANNSNAQNKANAQGTAQYDGNAKIADAKNAIANAAVNKDKINPMVNSAFALADTIKSLFETEEGSVVTQAFLGTCVNVKNKGTFISYGGKYIGYGMTPNIRNAVVECTKKGKVYVYDGLFEGRCGANIFNIVKAGSELQQTVQYTQDANGNNVSRVVSMRGDETNGLQIVELEDDGSLVDTSNIKVKGGTFRCYYEANMVGLHEDEEEGSNKHDSDNMTRFNGSAGGVNLGVTSYGEDFIRDGRIQIVDSYGDGALVLMDEESNVNDINHYRLYCTDAELRYKTYLRVYPTKSTGNSTYSFALKTRFDSTDTTNYEDLSETWNNDNENERAPFSSNEKFFRFPINDSISEKYYVIPDYNQGPQTTNTDTSEVWYYNIPLDAENNAIRPFRYYDTEVSGTKDGISQVYSQHDTKDWKNVEKGFDENSLEYEFHSFNYAYNVKWITYKIYRVDPLTRESISESAVFGEDKPLKQVVYGASGDLLKSRLQLTKLGIDYKPGEMYRIVVTVDEYMNYNQYEHAKNPASCESSIVFTCYDIDETIQQTITDSNGITRTVNVPDYTPLQWSGYASPGNYATVELINGQAGIVDTSTRKIFDVYYQWYLVGENGEEDELIAGMTNIYKGDKSGLQYRSVKFFSPDTDGFVYKNTVNPNDSMKDTYNENGLPFDKNTWTGEMIHAYLDLDTPDESLKKDKDFDLSLQNNNTFVTGRDRCYIPAEYAGRKIYCKAIAVNTLWPKNYDHVQVFYSHKMTVRKSTLDAPALTYSGDYATSDNPVKIKIPEIFELGTNEYVNKVVYKVVNNDMEYTLDNIHATSADSIKTVNYPNDFAGANSARAVPNGRIYAYVYTNKGNIFKTDTAYFDYEVKATDIQIQYANSYLYDNIYHVNNDWAKEQFKLIKTPASATVGYSFANDDSFTSSNPNVATFNAKGELVTGDEGTTVITVTTPQNVTKTMTVNVPIQKIEVKGISAPVVGEKLDTTAELPENANYSVQRIYWTEGSGANSLPLSSSTVAKAYTNYTVHVVLKENDGHKFLSDKNIGIEIPSEFTVNLKDGSTDTVKQTLYGKELTYYFRATADGESNIIDTIMINYPDEIAEGTSIPDWKNDIQIVCNASDIVKASYNMTFEKNASEIMSAYGLTSNDKTGIFISGVQNGVGAVLNLPETSDIEFASTVKVIVNDRNTYNISRYSSKEIQVYTNNTFTVKPAENVVIQPAPDFIVKPVNIAVGQTVDLADYVECKDKSVGLKFLSEVSDGRFTLDTENNTFTAVNQFNSSGHDTTTLNPYISVDMDGDGNNETFLKAVMTVTIYKNAGDIPTDNNVNLTVNILDADGKTVQTLTKTLVKNENTAMKVVEIPEIKGLITNSVECTGDTFYASGSNIGTYSIRQDTIVNLKTMKASDITVTPYAKEAKLSKYMIVSTDGVHWSRTNNITGLTPATNYTLYYKQGKESLIYTKKFTTASKDYGFSLGTEKITDLNNGTLEKDGWHYDENTNTLTLKNFNLTSKGTKTGSYSIGVSTYPRTTAAIVADNDLTICLIGENTITKLADSNTRHEDVIYGYGNITLTGNGNLTLTNTGYQYMSDGSGITSQKNIYLKNTGKLTINKAAGGFTCENGGTVYYYNGEIDYNGLLSSNVYYGSLIYDKGTLSIENKVHSLTAYSGEDDSTSFSESDIISNSQKEQTLMHIIPAHNCNKEVESSEYLASIDKANGKAYYYKSCECGHADTEHTFAVDYAEPLANISTISATSIKLGNTVTLTGKATGGTAPYTYAVLYKKKADTKWTVKQDFNTNASVEIKPANAVEYDVCVKVQDSAGNIEKKFFTVKVTNAVLTNNSTISATSITLGNTVTLTGKAAGGTAPYQYQVVYKKVSDTKWTTKQNFSTNTTVSIKPANAVDYDVCIKVKDGAGTVEKKFFTVKVTNAVLTNNSTISAAEIKLGNAVTLTGKASGGTAPYTYAMLYKKKTDTKWTTKQDFKANASVEIKPANAVEYDICVKVKDSTGTIEKKFFTVKVTNAVLTNNSTISATEIKLGNTVTLTGKAAGGTAPYTYAMLYKKKTDTKWTTKQDFKANASVEIKPANAVEYDFCVKVKDSMETVEKKYFSVTVK